jgi:translation initiation factor 1 (eIF-1/SUI1)
MAQERVAAPSKKLTMADFLRPAPADAGSSASSAGAARNNPQSNNATTVSPVLPYSVRATKKGGVPCAVESRKHHKVVVLSNIEGDVPALLSALQKSLGTGGVRKGTTIEVQGEHHLEKVRKFCLNSGCVVGASKQSKAEAAAAGNSKTKDNPKKSETTAKATKKAPPDNDATLSSKDIKGMKPIELKEHLAARQLPTQGNKKELLARLLLAASGKGN